MDDIDGTFLARQRKPLNSFQRELNAKMKERRTKGLTADITSEESDEESLPLNDDLLSEYSLSQQNRPGSAKHRSTHASGMQFGLDRTLTEDHLHSLLKKKTHGDEDDDDEDPMNRKSPGLQPRDGRFLKKAKLRESPKPPEFSAEDFIFGQKTKSRESPKALELSSDDLFGWKRETRESPKALELSSDDLFGRKTPVPFGRSPTGGLTSFTKQWQPPSFKHVSSSGDQEENLSAGPESGLQSTAESQMSKTPRHGQHLERKESESPRGMSVEDSERPTPRTRRRNDTKELTTSTRSSPSLDIFGKSRKEHSAEIEKELEDIEEKKNEVDRLQRRPGDRRTPTGQKSPNIPRRQETPTGSKVKETPPDHKSPIHADTARQTQSKKGQEPSLLDLMVGGIEPEPKREQTPKPKERPRKILKDKRSSGGSRDLEQTGESSEQQWQATDTSSLCTEVKGDPTAPIVKSVDERRQGEGVTERKTADGVIDTIANAQRGMQFIEPAKKIRPVSAHAKVEHRPKPRYGTLPGETVSPTAEKQFKSTTDIRSAVYEEWYYQRMKEAKKKLKEKEQKEKKEEEKKKKEKEEKENEAKLSYKAWQEQKKEVIAEQKAKKQEELERKREAEEKERDEKRKNAEVTFSTWKEKKDEYLKTLNKQNKMKQKEEKQKEEEGKKIKEKDGTTAYRKWKATKDAELTNKAKTSRKAQAQEVTNLDATRRMKEEVATAKYEEWMKAKEKQELRQKMEAHRRKMSGDFDQRPPWSPANHTIPFGR